MPATLLPWLAQLVLAVGVVLLVAASRVPALRTRAADLALLVAAGSAAAAVLSMNAPRGALAGGAIVADPWSTFLRFVLSTVATAVAWLATRARERDEARAEPGNETCVQPLRWAAFLASLLGAHVAVSAAHAASLVAGLEIASIGAALWIASPARAGGGRDAAVALLLEGAAATAVLLFGFVLLFGLGGELGWPALRGPLADAIPAPGAHAAIFAGVALVFAALAWRAALVPWHGARLDLVARASLPAATWLQVGLPLAALASFARFVRTTLVVAVDDDRWRTLPGVEWPRLVAVFAIATVAVAHVAALRERDVRRLFGWLATAQAGYLAVALTAPQDAGLAALLFHAIAAATMTTGAMVAIAPVVEADRAQDFEVLRGLARRGPGAGLLCACLIVFVLSFAAVLPTAGYEGRARILGAVIGAGGDVTALVLSAATLVGLVACTRVLVTLLDRPSAVAGPVAVDFEAALLAVLLAVATLAVGIAPGPLASLVERSAVVRTAGQGR